MSQVSLRCEECGKRLTILAATPLGSTKKDFLSVCSGCLFPHHGYSFKDTTGFRKMIFGIVYFSILQAI